MRTITRFRPDPMTGLALAAVAAGFMAGALAGTAATLATVSPAAIVEPCDGFPDPIGCLIAVADDEEDEPPQ